MLLFHMSNCRFNYFWIALCAPEVTEFISLWTVQCFWLEREPDSSKTAPFTVRRSQISSLIHTLPSAAFIVSFHMFSATLERVRHPGYLSSLLCVLVILRSLKQTQMGDLKGVLLRSEVCCTVKDIYVAADLPLSCSSTWDESRTVGQGVHSF